MPELPGPPLPLALAEPPDACHVGGGPRKWAGQAVLAARGGCSFAEKARVAQAGNATLLVIYNDTPGALPHLVQLHACSSPGFLSL